MYPDDIEKKCGHTFDEVRAHHDSDKPAQLQADAYTQKSNVHIAPGQEQHLPHDPSHVIQQKEGMTNPSRTMNTPPHLANSELEHEADLFGQ